MIGKIRRVRSQATSCSSETESHVIFVRIGTYWRTEKPLRNYQKKKLVRPVSSQQTLCRQVPKKEGDILSSLALAATA